MNCAFTIFLSKLFFEDGCGQWIIGGEAKPIVEPAYFNSTGHLRPSNEWQGI